MTEQFLFLGNNKCKAAIAAAVSLGVLLLLPASLGNGRTVILQEAFGQFDLPTLEDGQEGGGGAGGEIQATLPSTTSTFLLRGIIGSSLPAQGGDISTENSSSTTTTSYFVAGRWRIFLDEGLVNRFVAEMNLAAING